MDNADSNFHEKYHGNIDRADKSCVSGWVYLTANAQQPLTVNFFLDGRKINSTQANLYRQDLHDNNVGFGRCAFNLDLPEIFLHVTDGQTPVCRLEITDGPHSHLMAIGTFDQASLSLNIVEKHTAPSVEVSCEGDVSPAESIDYGTESNEFITNQVNNQVIAEHPGQSKDSTVEHIDVESQASTVESLGVEVQQAAVQTDVLARDSEEQPDIQVQALAIGRAENQGCEQVAHLMSDNSESNHTADTRVPSVIISESEAIAAGVDLSGGDDYDETLELSHEAVSSAILSSDNEIEDINDTVLDTPENPAPVNEPNHQTVFNENFLGNVEVIGGSRISGWVVDKQNYQNNVAVLLMVGGKCIARIIANQHRPDICAAGYGEGNCGFQIDLSKLGMSTAELSGDELLVEVVSGSKMGVMFSGHMPSEFGSLPDACKRELIAAFEQFQQAVPAINADIQEVAARPRSDISNGITQSLYRKAGAKKKTVGADIPELSPYVVFTRDRLNQHKTFEFESDARIAVDLLLWYVEGYGGMRKPHKIPLSNEEINYCNELVVFPNAIYSFSRLHYYMLLKNKPELNILGVLNNEEAYRSEVYEWVEDTCVKMNIIDVCVPNEYVDLLRSVEWGSKGFDFPLNKYFDKKLSGSDQWSCFDMSKSLHRGCVYLMLIMDSMKNHNTIRFVPDDVKRQFFDSTKFLEQLNSDVLEPFYNVPLDIENFRKTIINKLFLDGVDFTSGEFLSRTANGDRHAFANPHAAIQDTELFDVQLIGPLDKASGLGQATRLSANVLEQFDLSTNFVNFDLDNPAPEGFSTPVAAGELSKAKVNLIHLNAESVPFVMAYCPDVFTESYNIGYFFWELDTPARCHSLAMEMLDEVWVCTEYGVTQYKDYGDIPVHNVGMTYEESTTPSKQECKEYLKTEFGVSTDSTVYLATFDSFSFVQRKNPLAAIKAFKECFQGDEDVQLLIKTQNKNFVGDPAQLKVWRAIEYAIGGDTRIKLINRTFKYNELLIFKKAADCYVSLHRSEGWGFGMIEAMTLGVPVIATNYSGNLEFCKPDNCWLIDAPDKYLSETDYIFVVPGQKWSEPDISHAAIAMQECYENPEMRNEKASRAESYVFEHFSVSTISGRYKQRLDSILQDK